MAGTMKVFVFWLLYSSSSVFYVKNFFFHQCWKLFPKGLFIHLLKINHTKLSVSVAKRRHWKSRKITFFFFNIYIINYYYSTRNKFHKPAQVNISRSNQTSGSHKFCIHWLPSRQKKNLWKKHSCSTAIWFKIQSRCSLNYCTDNTTGTKITPDQWRQSGCNLYYCPDDKTGGQSEQ